MIEKKKTQYKKIWKKNKRLVWRGNGCFMHQHTQNTNKHNIERKVHSGDNFKSGEKDPSRRKWLFSEKRKTTHTHTHPTPPRVFFSFFFHKLIVVACVRVCVCGVVGLCQLISLLELNKLILLSFCVFFFFLYFSFSCAVCVFLFICEQHNEWTQFNWLVTRIGSTWFDGPLGWTLCC